MIRYTVAGMTEFADICLLFGSLITQRPEMFFDDVVIESVYGCFDGSKLGGGRNNLGAQASAAQIESVVSRYNSLGIGCNVTFSTQHACVKDLECSTYDNVILQTLAARDGNGVILYSDDLACSIKENYPALKLIASTTKELPTVAQTEGLIGLYDRAVLNYNLIHDRDELSLITKPLQLEVMVNEYCTLNCPFRKAHYRDISKSQYEGRQSQFQCRHEPSPQAYGFLQGLIDGDVFLKNSDVRRINRDYGIENFKIVGRGLERYDLVDALLYYLVQPDCWYEIRDFLIRHNYL